ncbi:MAG TPA: RNA polymerase sigma factor [Lichenihabitans sp.]|jgi:RNA polymerase sigma-70 factor (ECF subfamily)|nr:RNA polymerase sigma factor [Lichenihabitans sp.]
MDQAQLRQTDWGGTPDLGLIAPIAAGNIDAFAVLVRRHNRTLYRAARSITGDDTEAEDVVQEAWTRAYAHLTAFRSEAQLSTWLVRIAVNEALGRKRRRRPSIAIDAMDERQMSTIIQFRAPAPDQESDLARTEVRAMLEKAIDTLPAPFRVVFVLRAVEDLGVEDIASQLDISPATVRTRLFRARALLRKDLEKSFHSSLSDVFPFDGARCRAVTHRVLALIEARR